MNELHHHWMQYCLVLALKALESGNPPVGSVLVQGDVLLGEGIEAGKTHQDITYHAEIEAVRDAVRKSGQKYFPEAILYTTHEPCMMCSYVIRHHRIGAVVMGIKVPEIGGYSSKYPILTATDIGIWAGQPTIIEGILAEDCLALQEAYIQQNQSKK